MAENQGNQPYQPGQPHPSGDTTVQRPTGATVTGQQPGQTRTLNQQGQQVGPDGLTDEQRKAKEKEDADRKATEERARRGL